MTKDENTARDCASRNVDAYIPGWGCPHTFLSDRGAEFISQVRTVYEMLGAVEKCTNSYHPQTNGMVETLNHTL